MTETGAAAGPEKPQWQRLNKEQASACFFMGDVKVSALPGLAAGFVIAGVTRNPFSAGPASRCVSGSPKAAGLTPHSLP
jgi:hypothetical protein